MGYDPKVFYTGRSPLEAVSMGVKMSDTDVALRCNLVTLSDDEPYEKKTMVDYCADDISTEEAAEIIDSVQKAFGNETFEYHTGISYRHCLIWHNGTTELGDMTPPHDISGRCIEQYLSSDENAAPLIDMMRKSYEFLKDHPVNRARVARGKRPANSIWLWGQGKKPALESFEKKFGLKGTVVSAVDLIKGIGICAGMNVPDVDGATGYIDTNFDGKVRTAVEALKNGSDFAYIHVEAPDECGHRNEPENKVRAIELIDEKILSVLLKELKNMGDFKIMVLPDHATPIVTRTHAGDPVPYLIYHDGNKKSSGVDSINEETAKSTGVFVENGPDIMRRFIEID